MLFLFSLVELYNESFILNDPFVMRYFYFCLQLLKELDLNVDVDVALLAAQTPPIKIFPASNTSHLPYNEQMATLESDYIRYYEYRGDLKYHEKMKRCNITKGIVKSADASCLYRVCRDKKSFFETRIKDDVLILGKILESMIERTSEMEKHLENVLLESGEKELPNWDKLYEEIAHNTTPEPKNDGDVQVMPKITKRSATARKPRGKKIAEIKQNLIAAPNQSNGDQSQPVSTHEQNQMRVAQMMLARSLAHGSRIHSNGEHSYAASRPGTASEQQN